MKEGSDPDTPDELVYIYTHTRLEAHSMRTAMI